MTRDLTYKPAFTLHIAVVALGEIPSRSGIFGVLVIVAGRYLLNLRHRRAGWLQPLAALVRQRAMLLALWPV